MTWKQAIEKTSPSTLLTAAVTAVTVTLCSRRAALRNPVESISNE
jgi:hypothetical protein